MKRFFILIALLLSGILYSSAQKKLETNTVRDDKNNAAINVTLPDRGIYTIVLELVDPRNTMTGKLHRSTVNADRTILRLRPTDSSKPVSFGHRTKHFAGSVNPRNVDSMFVYRLPYTVSESRKVVGLSNFSEKYLGKNDRTVNFKAFQFMMNPGDYVYPVRKGIVLRVVDEHDPDLSMGTIAMRTKNNEIYVEHADGTTARYGVLEKGSISVGPGDMVYPDTPIARAGTYDGQVWQLRLAIYYRMDNFGEIFELSNYALTQVYLDPVFATSEGETKLTVRTSYIPVENEELVTKEMTKKEIKARK